MWCCYCFSSSRKETCLFSYLWVFFLAFRLFAWFLSCHFSLSELGRKWKVKLTRRKKVLWWVLFCIELINKTSSPKWPTSYRETFTLHANIILALLHSHTGSFAPLRWCAAIISLCPSLPSLQTLFPAGVSQSRMNNYENYAKIASSRCDRRRLRDIINRARLRKQAIRGDTVQTCAPTHSHLTVPRKEIRLVGMCKAGS